MIFFCKKKCVLNSETYYIEHFQVLANTSKPQCEDNAISHNIVWYKIRFCIRTDASFCVPTRLHLHKSHRSFTHLKCHYATALLNINFPALQTRPSLLIVTLTTSRPLRSEQLILPMLTTLLGKNNMLVQEMTEEILGKKKNLKKSDYLIIFMYTGNFTLNHIA